MHSMFGNTYVWEYIFYNESSQIEKQKSDGKRERLDDGLRLVATNTGIDKGTIVAEKPHVSHW